MSYASLMLFPPVSPHSRSPRPLAAKSSYTNDSHHPDEEQTHSRCHDALPQTRSTTGFAIVSCLLILLAAYDSVSPLNKPLCDASRGEISGRDTWATTRGESCSVLVFHAITEERYQAIMLDVPLPAICRNKVYKTNKNSTDGVQIHP